MSLIAVSLGSPTSSTPATIPKESSSICTAPYTSRLAPPTTSPEASSTVAVVSTAPGRNVTRGAISVRSPGSTAPCLTAAKIERRDDHRREDRDEQRQRLAASSEPDEASDEYAEDRRGRHVTRVGCRMRQMPTVISA